MRHVATIRTCLLWLLTLACPALAALPTIEWDPSTLRLIETNADYARLVRLGDGRIGCVYDKSGKMWVRHSADEGVTWADPILVAEESECWLTNAEVLLLKNGYLLYFWNERPLAAVRNQRDKSASVKLTRPFLIRMSRSTDHGNTWSAPQTLFAAGVAFHDGCWEPAGIQLPSGEVQVYFANEAPFPSTSEQEISLLRSTDNGKTWGTSERVAFRKHHRDGMPAPLLLADDRGIAVAIEDEGYAGRRFKPVIVHTTLADNWHSSSVLADGPHRWGALTEPLDPAWYAGAPSLRRLPGGPTLLSFQESTDGSMKHCRMAVCVGDPDARNFSNKTYPFGLPAEGNQLWNSLFVKDAQTVTAVSNTTVNGVREIRSIDGRMIAAPTRSNAAAAPAQR
jgi:hypothetical protein